MRLAPPGCRRPASRVRSNGSNYRVGSARRRWRAFRQDNVDSVAIATVLVRESQLWLLDEPHAGLDEQGRGILDALIEDAASNGATVLFASHELERARTVARRVVEMRGGACVVAQGKSSKPRSAGQSEVGLDVA